MIKTRDILSFAAYAVLAAAILFTAGVQLNAGQPWRQPPWFWLGFLGFMCWGLLPYALLINQVRFLRKRNGHVASISLLLAIGVVITTYAVWALVQAFFIHPDAQSGIVLIIVPGGQLLVCFIAIALAMLVNAVLNRRAKTGSNQQGCCTVSSEGAPSEEP